MKRPADGPELQRGQRIELQVEKLVATGRGLARVGGQVVFVDGLLPGDRAEAEIVAVRRDYAEARPLRVLDRAILRQASVCPVFERCGGCDWLDLGEAEQLQLQRQMAEDALSRLHRLQPFPILGPVASPQRLGYRRRAQLKVAEDGRLGFYARGSRDVVPVEACPVLAPSLERLLGPLQALARDLPQLREVHLLAGSEESAVALLSRAPLEADPQAVAQRLRPHGAGPILFDDGTNRAAGPGFVSIRVGDHGYRAPVRSFFQGNLHFDELLVQRVVEATLGHPGARDAHGPAGELVTSERVLELYCGVGFFTLPLAARAAQLTAVELDASACAAARENLREAGLRAEVLNLDATQVVPRLRQLGPQRILVDPPRTGLDRAVREGIAGSSAHRLVYLSCNPTTLARDLLELLPSYAIRRVELLDLFPQTVHLETLAVLDRRGPPGFA